MSTLRRVVIRGDPNAGSFTAYYLAGTRLLALDAINSPRDFMHAKKLIASGTRITADELRDPSTDVNALAG